MLQRYRANITSSLRTRSLSMNSRTRYDPRVFLLILLLDRVFGDTRTAIDYCSSKRSLDRPRLAMIQTQPTVRPITPSYMIGKGGQESFVGLCPSPPILSTLLDLAKYILVLSNFNCQCQPTRLINSSVLQVA